MARIIFGSENAETDRLLYECQVRKHTIREEKPILTGRWGTGKTALLLLQNQRLSNALKEFGADKERLWYIGENTLDLSSLLDLRTSYASDPQQLIRSLEELWKAEILRVYVQVLATLRSTYRKSRGPHWDFVTSSAQANETSRAIWKQVPHALAALVGREGLTGPIQSAQNSIKGILHERSWETVNTCLQDIDDDEVQPAVAIEPIETPTSGLEHDKSLARALISALLNVYRKFEPGPGNYFNVRIAIPWHRFSPADLDFPQKLDQYEGPLSWERGDLREFINKRITWEFERVGRRFVVKGNNDAWSTLFEGNVPNGFCAPAVRENSFEYFLRHTHHRARDLQRLARKSVEAQADLGRISVDDVIKKGKVTASVIKDTFRREMENSLKELVIEAGRRYPLLQDVVSQLRGIPVPFTTDVLQSRIIRARETLDVTEALKMLWNSGIVGVSAVPLTTEASKRLERLLTSDARRTFNNEAGKRLMRWCWFEYNHKGEAADLLEKLKHVDDVETGLILHSKAVEHLVPQIRDVSSPLGI
jgi:hypothetical protein